MDISCSTVQFTKLVLSTLSDLCKECVNQINSLETHGNSGEAAEIRCSGAGICNKTICCSFYVELTRRKGVGEKKQNEAHIGDVGTMEECALVRGAQS